MSHPPPPSEKAIGDLIRHAALVRHAEEIEARIASGDNDADLADDALAARGAALSLERNT